MSSIANMNILELYNDLVLKLSSIYNIQESKNIASLIFENLTEIRNVEKINAQESLNLNQIEQFRFYTSQLLNHKPVQYVINEAWFDGMNLLLDESVLIPRPETEELVDWIRKTYSPNESIKILEVGTGSGCIALSLKKYFIKSTIVAIDVSEKALLVAKKNAQKFSLPIDFMNSNFLTEFNTNQVFNIIVSNPPYISIQESKEMKQHVLQFEPHEALFVENSDPLIFYNKIAAFGRTHLTNTGSVFVEINEAYGTETKTLFESYNYSEVIIKKDMQGKDRMIQAKY